MKILIAGLATFEQMTGGSARYLSGVASALEARGNEVAVVTAASRIHTRGFSQVGFRGQLSRSLQRLFVVMPTMAFEVLRRRPDVVYSHFALDGAAAVLAARVMRTPVVVMFQGPWASEARATGLRGRWPLSNQLRRAIERFVYRRASTCITLSRAFASLLEREYGISPSRITVIPGGIDSAHFAPAGDRAAVRRSLGWPDVFTIVTVRRLVPRMGLDIAIRAIPLVTAEMAVELVIAGSGPEESRLRELADEYGVASQVHFLGRVPENALPSVYAAADLCVVPSRELEGFGYVALEALAAGTPVIAAETGGLSEIIGPLEPRWLVPAEPQPLADAIKGWAVHATEFPSRAQCIAYASKFDWEIIGAEVEKILASATTRR